MLFDDTPDLNRVKQRIARVFRASRCNRYHRGHTTARTPHTFTYPVFVARAVPEYSLHAATSAHAID
jgi:hypothetical protein